MTFAIPEIDPDFENKHEKAILDYLDSDGDGHLDIYSQDPGAWAPLSRAIPGLIITSAGGMCPYQAEGTLKGHPFYFRYRHGYADLRAGEYDSKVMPYLDGALWHSGVDYGDTFGGALSSSEFTTLMIELVPALNPAKFYWKFEGRKVIVEGNSTTGLSLSVTDKTEICGGWGITPEQALLQIASPSDYLLENGWSLEDQALYYKLKKIDPKPINKDDRVWPDPQPVFEVTLD